MLRHCSSLLFLLSIGASFSPGANAPPVRSVLDKLSKTVEFGEARIAPDGTRVAWTERLRNADGSESSKTAIYVAPLGDRSKAVRVSAGDGKESFSENGIAWSPDSGALVFFSDREQAKQPQLYSIELSKSNAGGAAAKKLTSVKGEIRNAQFSRDGSLIAFSYLENAKAVGPLDAYTPEVGVIETDIHEQRVAIVNLQTGAMKVVSPPNMFVYEFDWSPGGKQLAYTAAEGDGDNNWWIAKLYTLNVASGQQKLVCKPEAQIAEPHWSPDGKQIAYIGGLMSDQGFTGGDIYLAPSDGGQPKNLTPGMKASVNWLQWERGETPKLLVGEFVDGGFGISEVSATDGEREQLWQGSEQMRSADVARDNRTSVAIRSSWAKPPEVIGGKIGSWSAVTEKNDDLKPLWGKSEKLHWNSAGREINGWLLYPANFESGKKYPMVVSIHGGPAGQASPSWPQSGLSLLATQGMFVFFPNPRGSYGEGESFTKANVKDFGYGDLTDILAGVDEVLKKAPVDGNRLGVSGWSYGGFMTMWTITQTQRFKAAVAGAGISDWKSYYGENLIDQWMIPYFGASVYDDPAVYAKSSPINFVKQVKTPTLIVVGERDAECPMPQSREMWHALKSLGVKTQLVVYPNEGHHFRNPEHVADLTTRTVNWFKENLK